MALVSTIYGNNGFSKSAIKQQKKNAMRKQASYIAECYAQELVEHATPAEIAFQHILVDLRIQFIFQKAFNKKKKHGFKIVDFWLPQFKLAVEIDGGYHNNPFQQWKDKCRTNTLLKKNRSKIKNVIRFTNDEVLNHPDIVKEKLLNNGNAL